MKSSAKNKIADRLVSKRTILFAAILIAGNTARGSAWFKNKLDPHKNAEVVVTAVKWGAPDDHARNTEDRLVLQVASDNYRKVTLIFESQPIKGKKYCLRVTTDVHLRFRHSRKRDRYSEMFFPSKPGLNNFNLVDVQADNTSVYYTITSNSGTNISRNAFRISLPLKTQFKNITCQLSTLDEADTGSTPILTTPTPTEETITVTELIFNHPTGKAFEKLALELVQQYQTALQQFGDSYLAALDHLEERVQNAADLEGVVAVKTERDRFNLSRQVPDSAFSDYDAVKRYQLSYRQGEETIRKRISALLQELSASYVDKLKPIQDDFTKSGEIEAALSIQKEIACVKAAPKLLIEPEAEPEPEAETASASEETSPLPSMR